MSIEQLLGRRVVVRHRRRDTAERPGPPLSDLVGELTDVTGSRATVVTRTGPVTVALSDITTYRPVAPARAAVLELEAVSRRGWRAAEVVDLDGWLLHLDQGWTGRANSVLPLRTPGRPIGPLLAEVQQRYLDRGLQPAIAVPLPARGLLDAELAARCWVIERPSIVLTRTIAGYPDERAAEPELSAELTATPSPAWLGAYHYRGGALPDFAVDLLTRHEDVRFLSLFAGDQLAGIARGTVDDGWLGVTAVEVSQPLRRRGVGFALMRRLTDWGRQRGAVRCCLQVDEANSAAVAFYRRLGFTEHHRYHYRVPPAG